MACAPFNFLLVYILADASVRTTVLAKMHTQKRYVYTDKFFCLWYKYPPNDQPLLGNKSLASPPAVKSSMLGNRVMLDAGQAMWGAARKSKFSGIDCGRSTLWSTSTLRIVFASSAHTSATYRFMSSKPNRNTGNEGQHPQLPQVQQPSAELSQPDKHSHSHAGGGIFSHSHSHSHSHQPNELLLLSEGIFKNPAVRITWIGLFVNVGMAASKAAGGVYFHSQSLLADAIHSVSDMIADFLTLATVNVLSKIGSPTRFPLGYGKIETIGSLLVSGVLLFAGISVGWSSLLQILEFTLPHYIYEYVSMIQIGHSHSHAAIDTSDSTSLQVHSHSHGGGNTDLTSANVATQPQSPAIAGAWLAGGSILVKELLFKKTMKVAEETNSKVLVANAWHHRVDSLTSMVALVTITGSYLFNVAWLDSIGGAAVSFLIIRTGWATFKTAWFELVDRGEPRSSEAYGKIMDIAQAEVKEITDNGFNVSDLSVMTSGANSNIYITLRETTPRSYLLKEINSIETRLVAAIKKDDKFIKNIFILFKASPT